MDGTYISESTLAREGFFQDGEGMRAEAGISEDLADDGWSS